ncbi:MAG: hypothetical protein QNJ45_13360 [Ardenticatenaceae bacterium]|nr:hypothetical protein [Ardenticatenaceae bacterium]
MNRLHRPLFILALLLFWWLALSSLANDSPTMDEPNHLTRGVTFVLTGDPRLSVEHPPLINALSGRLATLTPHILLPLEDPSWQRQPSETFWYLFADRFSWDVNRDRLLQMVFLGRLPIVLLTMLMAAGAARFAQRLWGGLAGLAALLGLLFDPNIIAHGRYITTDLGGTAFIFLATAVLWHIWTQRRPRFWPDTLLLAVVMGLAFTSKLLTLGFIPIWSVLALLPLYRPDDGWRRGGRRLFQLWLAGFVSIFVVWAIFAFEWGPFLFLDPSLSWLNVYSAPMPTFWSGIERILLLSGGGRPTFLLGELSTSGFWNYFPVALAVKTPLLTLLLLAAAFLVGLAGHRASSSTANAGSSSLQKTVFLILPAVFYFAISMTSALNIGYRHLLPILPFVYLLIAGLWGKNILLPAVWTRLRLWILPLFLLPALWIYPHYLSYFNLAAGGPANGHHILIDSNIDWGQDLARLQQWMIDREVEEIKLAWFGTADPSLYDINYQPLPGLPRHFELWWAVPFNRQNPDPGIYVISASNLWELPLEEKTVFAWFRAREPDEKVGYSLFVYVVE